MLRSSESCLPASRKRAAGFIPSGVNRRLTLPGRAGSSYWLLSAGCSSLPLRWAAHLRWNFSTRPVVSTYFILPVKNGWHAEQISTVMFFLVLRVVNLLPQPQTTVASTYLG